ncbi:MAG: D,D-dipeptide ABC transporter permease, partial [Microvirga sp.]
MAGAPLAQQPEGLRAWLLSPEPHSRWQARLGRLYLGWRAFAKNPLAVLGLAIVALLILVAIFADALAPYSPIMGGDLRTQRLLPPSETFWLGTDDQARDILSRIIYGSRITLFVVVLVSIIATPIGL